MMTKKAKLQSAHVVLGCFVLAFAIGSVLLTSDNRGVAYVDRAEETAAEAFGLPESIEAIHEISAVYADFSFEDFCGTAEMVCSGEYIGCSDAFMIQPVNGAEPMHFTDYYFAVDGVYKGELPQDVLASKQNRITVRQQGGVGERVATVNETAAQPVEGESYLLFLYTIEDGSEYNTEGDHFYLMSGAYGAWPLLKANDSFASPRGNELVGRSGVGASVESAIVAFEKSTIAAIVPAVSGKDAFADEMEQLYLDGAITKGDYDSIMSDLEREANSFARIMTEEEVRAYEDRVVGATQALR